MPERSGRIVIVVDLPQPMDKVTKLMEALGKQWPNAAVNARPPVQSVEVAGGSLVMIEAQ